MYICYKPQPFILIALYEIITITIASYKKITSSLYLRHFPNTNTKKKKATTSRLLIAIQFKWNNKNIKYDYNITFILI